MKKNRDWILGLALFLITMAGYWPATSFPFIALDDQEYVYNNANVLGGLSWGGVTWSATSVVGGNWHPVTIWSHMVDSSIYGGEFAGGHHLTNIVFHALNAVLLMLLLKRLTGWFWPSALVAALFAWHPLNVESVAWVSERKNVLSTFFFILTLWTYWHYVTASNASRHFAYMLSLFFFALGLASKAMLVTLPCLLLLLDYWPLRRIGLEPKVGEPSRQKPARALLVEKIPFLMLMVADCWITFWVQNQSGAVRSFSTVPLEHRLSNIPVAYVTYLVKTFWPDDLCVFYLFPPTLHIVAAMASLLLLAVMTAMVWHWRVRLPWLLVGWFWFLGTLVPVIGLVQVGGQAWADRYAYVPLIGLFLIVACGLHQGLAVWPQLRIFVVTGVMLVLALCLMLTGRQLLCWRSSVALFTKALAVNPENAPVENLLGRAWAGNGETAKAVEHYAAAVRLFPSSAQFQYDLGRALINANQIIEAQDHLAAANAQSPNDPVFHNAYGVALVLGNRLDEAQKEFGRAIELKPDYANAYFNLGKCFLTAGQSQSAITNFIKALQFEPDRPEAWQKLAGAYAASGDITNAISKASRALKLALDAKQHNLADQIAAELKTYQTASTPQSSALPRIK